MSNSSTGKSGDQIRASKFADHKTNHFLPLNGAETAFLQRSVSIKNKPLVCQVLVSCTKVECGNPAFQLAKIL